MPSSLATSLRAALCLLPWVALAEVSGDLRVSVDSSSSSPLLLLQNGDWISVRYDSAFPLPADLWIGVYRCCSAGFSDTAEGLINSSLPVRLALAPATRGARGGTVRLELTNYRGPLTVLALTGSFESPLLVWRPSPLRVVDVRDADEPLRPRLLSTRDRDALLLVWSSNASVQPLVQYGDGGGEGLFARTAVASTRRLTPSDVCGRRAGGLGWADLGAIHYAWLTGLRGARSVAYRFGDANGTWAAPATAVVPRAPGADGARIAVVGDLGGGSRDDGTTWGWADGGAAANTTASLAAAATRGDLDMIAIIGDQSYAVGALAVWDAWLDALSRVVATVALAPLRGNHEEGGVWQQTDSGGECGAVSQALLPAPAPAEGDAPLGDAPPDPRALAATPGWWSLDVGRAHIVGIATEAALGPATQQYAWLSRDLAAVNRSLTPWLVLLAHRPLLVDSSDAAPRPGGSDQQVAAELRRALEPLLWAHRVNLVISGHNHAVQRHSASLRGQPLHVADGAGTGVAWQRGAQGPVHLVWGTGGAPFTRNADGRAPTIERVMYLSGYGIVSALNRTHLRADWVSSADGAVVDTLWLTRDDSDGVVWAWPVEAIVVTTFTDSALNQLVSNAAVIIALGLAAVVWAGRRLLARRKYAPIAAGTEDPPSRSGGAAPEQ